MKRYLVEVEKRRGWIVYANWPTRETAEMDAARLRPTITKTVRVREIDMPASNEPIQAVKELS